MVVNLVLILSLVQSFLDCFCSAVEYSEIKHLKGHGNEADFPRCLHKSVRYWSFTLLFKPFRF